MNKMKSAVIALALFAPATALAGSVQIGTSPLLLALGVTNVYGQVQLGDTSAIVGSYSSIDGTYTGSLLSLTGYSLAYKGYFSNYANGGYWELGAASFDVIASAVSNFSVGTLVIPIAVAGYEKSFGHLVLGAEGGIGTGGGWGLLGANAAYQF